ncbi:uncharacterized protein LOC111252501 isoform X2 [Varroa destructor]|uniref:Ribosomal protein L20 n=2 Tax=Varroa destructor TaxID=109461 RepID=A0A7M7KG60_VARDE|nr:uncharacterized protein LOC111252501 isoform X2 [Varroa destructor]
MTMMVNLTATLFRLVKHPANKYWKRNRVFQYCGHFYGRRRNVYSVAIRSLWKAWEHAQSGRVSHRRNVGTLWSSRIGAAAEELGVRGGYFPFVHGLARASIALDRKVLADIAWTEPRTFRSLVDISLKELAKDAANATLSPDNVIDGDFTSNETSLPKMR